jgi:hypothetical protein
VNFLAELNREVQKSKIFIILPWIVDFHGKLPVFFVYPIIHTHKYIHIPKTVYGPETMIKTSPRGGAGPQHLSHAFQGFFGWEIPRRFTQISERLLKNGGRQMTFH